MRSPSKKSLPWLCLVVIIALGILIRIPLLSQKGFVPDESRQAHWMHSVTTLGVAESYRYQLDPVIIPNYGPVEIVLFDFFGHLLRTISSSKFPLDLRATFPYIKMIAMLADTGVGLLLFFFFRRLGFWRLGLIASAVYLFNPVSLAELQWGQTDALLTFFLFAFVMVSASKHWFLCGMCFTLAYLAKPTAVMLFPLLVFLLCFSGGYKRIVAGILATLAVFAVPFVMHGNITSFLRYLLIQNNEAINHTTRNIYWLLYHWHFPLLSAYSPNPTQRIWSFLAFCTLSLGLLFAWKKTIREPRALMLAAAVVSFLFFVIVVGVHERYIFPFIAFATPLLFISWEGAAIYILTSIITYRVFLKPTFSGLSILIPVMRVFVIPRTVIVILNLSLLVWLLWFTYRHFGEVHVRRVLKKESL